jgi:hypoxanthine phosphoribosyltransferase
MSSAPEVPGLGGLELRRVVYDAETIARRVGELGQEVTAAYAGGELLLLGLLKGSFIFIADLARAIGRPLQVDFMVASSYGNATASSGNVRLLYDPATDLAGKHVVVVEDIIDTGRTLQRLLTLLASRRPASLAVCALLDKKIAPPIPEVRFTGFECPNAFLVGYGLDHAERYRHLPFIAELAQESDG